MLCKNKEDISLEHEVAELVRIIGQQKADFQNSNMVFSVFNKLFKEYQNNSRFAAFGVYIMGYIYGIRAERKRKKKVDK